jgi:hypothetical protein
VAEKNRGERLERSQVMELFLSMAEAFGITGDEAIAALADAGPESVQNWRSGAVREFKPKKLQAAIANLRAQVATLRAMAGGGGGEDLSLVHVERGSSPADLQRDFRDRVTWDYAGHRFLYYEPQGALAWHNLIGAGYEQDAWVLGVEACARDWLSGDAPLAAALGIGRRETVRGLELISLGCGEAAKEMLVVRRLIDEEARRGVRLRWLELAPVDVSIPLLLAAARSSVRVLAERAERLGGVVTFDAVLPFCADFEEGSLRFAERLASAQPERSGGVRLITLLGNVFGNLRDEESFVRKKLNMLVRPGDLVWLEVGLRTAAPEDDPLFAMTRSARAETPAEANRRLLLEGPYRRWAAALGRSAPDIAMRIWVREADESTRVPASLNFTHDLMIRDENRAVTMLYSRRYEQAGLVGWLERLGYDLQAARKIKDARGIERVLHLLVRRRAT